MQQKERTKKMQQRTPKLNLRSTGTLVASAQIKPVENKMTKLVKKRKKGIEEPSFATARMACKE